jgi:N-acetylglucosamine-6-phosphate deacetylase
LTTRDASQQSPRESAVLTQPPCTDEPPTCINSQPVPTNSVNDDMICFTGRVVLPDGLIEHGAVLCRGARIVAAGARADVAVPADVAHVDAGDGYVSPGFVDIHVHGGDGADYMDGDIDAVRTANRCHARHGTTSIFPTTTTGSREQITAMLRACEQVQRDWTIADGARIAGVHFYGPYFAEDKVGCHRLEGRRDPDPAEYREHLATGIIKVATCAAELPGAEAFYREAAKRGCLVTCGHSNASWAEMARAFEAGMRHVDHFWCAMSSVLSVRMRLGTPMQGSMEQFVLANAEMSTEVLADGCHLSPELLAFAHQVKGAKRLCLVTDSSRALDQPPGRYRFGCRDDGEWFENNGRVGVMPGGTGLASSVVGMDTMVRTMKTGTRAPLADVIRMASLTPAERVGLDADIGSLACGKRADLVLLDAALNVRRVYIGGVELPPARQHGAPTAPATVFQ